MVRLRYLYVCWALVVCAFLTLDMGFNYEVEGGDLFPPLAVSRACGASRGTPRGFPGTAPLLRTPSRTLRWPPPSAACRAHRSSELPATASLVLPATAVR